MLKDKKTIFLIIGVLILSASNVFAKDFTDVAKKYWAYVAIEKTTELGITNGYPDGTFLPESKVTRAEFSKMLVEGLDLKEKSNLSFEDVTQEFWGHQYIQVASNYLDGKLSGDKLYYNPNTPAVREEMAIAIVKAMGLEKKVYSMKKLDKFSDLEDISEEAKKYVLIASENKLMIGNENGTFNPHGTLTRAEASQLILNLLDYKEEAKKKPSSSKRPSSSKPSGGIQENVTYEYEWQDVEDSIIEQAKLYIKNSKGEYVSGRLKLTTLSGATIIENVTENGSENMYIKLAISTVEIEETF